MPLTTLTANNTARAADVNGNFALCVLTDTARTIVITHTWSASQTFTGGWTAGAACTVSTGGLTITAGGLTVTADGLTVTAGGLTVTAGALKQAKVELTYGANVAVNAALGNAFYLDITDNVAFQIDAPTNATDGQHIAFILDNTSGGTTGTITFQTGTGGGAYSTAFSATLGSGRVLLIEFVYVSEIAEWIATTLGGNNVAK